MAVKSIDVQQLGRLLLSEDKKSAIRALLKLSPEAQLLLSDDDTVAIQSIRVNKPETQADYAARIQTSTVGSRPPPKRARR
jgi:hypothetical protein